MPELLSELTFGSFLQYSPHGTSDRSRLSRKWRDAVKQYHPSQVGRAMDMLAQAAHDSPLRELLGADRTLIPTPRSAPAVKGALWPAMQLSEEMRDRGLGARVVPLLRRQVAVQKSAYAQSRERPTARQHLDSLGFESQDLFPPPGGALVLVDDFITRGATLLACATLLKARFPGVDVYAFAFVRTMSSGEVTDIIAPARGVIRLTGDATFRMP